MYKEIFPRKKRKPYAQTLSQTRRDERLLLLRVFFDDVFLFLRVVDEMRTKFPGASFLFVLVVCFFFPFLSLGYRMRGEKTAKIDRLAFSGEDPLFSLPRLSLSLSLSLTLSLSLE